MVAIAISATFSDNALACFVSSHYCHFYHYQELRNQTNTFLKSHFLPSAGHIVAVCYYE